MRGFSQRLPFYSLVQAIRLRDWYLWGSSRIPAWNKPWDGLSLEPHKPVDHKDRKSRWWKHAFECGCELETTKVIERCPSHPDSHVVELNCVLKPENSC